MNHKESLLSLTEILKDCFMSSVWPWISLERYNYWRQSLRTSSTQCRNNPVLVTTHRPPDHVKGFYDGHTYDLKTSVDIWTRMNVVPVEYGSFSQRFHLTMWFFQFITGISFKWDYMMGRIIDLMVQIFIWIKLRIFKFPPDPVIWSCQGFGSLWRAFMLICMLGFKNDFKVSHRKQFNAP